MTPDDATPWAEIQADPKVECATVAERYWCRAYGTTSAALTDVGEIIEHREDYPRWYPHVAEVKSLDGATHYTRIGMPSPFADRDQVFVATKSDEGDARIYQWHAVENASAPELPGVVRLVDAGGEWRIAPQSGGGTSLRYQWCAEMGGSFPSWAQSRAALLHASEMIDGTRAAAEARGTP